MLIHLLLLTPFKVLSSITLVTAPSLILSVFRIVPKHELYPQILYPLEELNELNRIYFSRLSSRSDIMVVSTTINGIYCIRFAVGQKTSISGTRTISSRPKQKLP